MQSLFFIWNLNKLAFERACHRLSVNTFSATGRRINTFNARRCINACHRAVGAERFAMRRAEDASRDRRVAGLTGKVLWCHNGAAVHGNCSGRHACSPSGPIPKALGNDRAQGAAPGETYRMTRAIRLVERVSRPQAWLCLYTVAALAPAHIATHAAPEGAEQVEVSPTACLLSWLTQT